MIVSMTCSIILNVDCIGVQEIFQRKRKSADPPPKVRIPVNNAAAAHVEAASIAQIGRYRNAPATGGESGESAIPSFLAAFKDESKMS
jgi:hypothetical protein